MSEFDDKLSAILGDPNAMNRIMALAQSLTGPEAGEGEPLPCEDRTMGHGQDVELLSALRPYLKQKRRKKLDRAIELLQLMRMLKGNRE